MYNIIVKNLHIPVEAPIEELYALAKKKLGVSNGEFRGAALNKRSIDARRRSGRGLEFVCSVNVSCELSERRLERLLASPECELVERGRLEPVKGSKRLEGRPIVVGFGPCGMFAALLLAENGYRPLVVERGSGVSERVSAVERFNLTGELDPDTNIQFGAGGAGTFSDGKLVTRINDPRCSYVLERFVEFGAPEEVLWLAKPHIGTDRLLSVVDRIRERIVSLGGEVRFDTKLVDLTLRGGRVDSVGLEQGGCGSGEVAVEPVGALILAIGHSARDTYDLLASKGISLEPKPFSVGVRVEHLQSDIDYALYGDYADKLGADGGRLLPPGEYSLSLREKQEGLISDSARGVYSFCMCPGGEVVAAASELGGVVTNGMSRYARDGRNANSAIAVSVFPEDIGGGWRAGIEFQRELEARAFKAGSVSGVDYAAPIEALGDFLDGKTSGFTSPSRVKPTYRESAGAVTLCDLSGVLPGFVSDMLKKGFRSFGRKLRGFDSPDAILTGVETRTSAPVRIPRGESLTVSSAENLYPGGEGAGYAGGITSAAVDGINIAMRLIGEYAPE